MTILVTGVAGFVGAHVAQRLLARGERVIGLDSFNAYYNPALKEARVARMLDHPAFSLLRLDIADTDALAEAVRRHRPDQVVHLAAQAGVRYSLEAPFAYERANLLGHLSVLEACRRCDSVGHLVYASSSSVYGDRMFVDGGFRETDAADAPVSLYAATKRSCELMSASYAHLYGLPQSGLRFFTVYGPWGRPDMAYWIFTRNILAGRPVEVFGEGDAMRDFTFIDDIVDGVTGVLDRPPPQGVQRILNIGDNRPVAVRDMIATLESLLGRKAERIIRPRQAGDVSCTFANIDAINALTGYRPVVPLEAGLERFVAWFRAHEALAMTG